MRAQWSLQQNMCAEYVRVDPKKPEVEKLVPRASDHIVRVDPRQEDVCFATAVAHVVLRHVEGLALQMRDKLPGVSVGVCLCVCVCVFGLLVSVVQPPVVTCSTK